MRIKQKEIDVPTTLDYRLKSGIKDRPSVESSEAKHVEK